VENCSQTLYAVGAGWGLGKDIRCVDRRPGQSIYYDRQHHRARSSVSRLRKGGARREALGRSRGGLSTKIHMCTDAFGRPLRFILTGGQCNDYTQALDLIDGFRLSHVLADKGYDSDNILDAIASMKAVPVICRDQTAKYEEYMISKFINAGISLSVHSTNSSIGADSQPDTIVKLFTSRPSYIWLQQLYGFNVDST